MDISVDITGTPSSTKTTQKKKQRLVRKKKRLSDGTVKEYCYQRPARINTIIDVSFKSEADKKAFDEKLTSAKELLQLTKVKTVSHAELLDHVLNVFLEMATGDFASSSDTNDSDSGRHASSKHPCWDGERV